MGLALNPPITSRPAPDLQAAKWGDRPSHTRGSRHAAGGHTRPSSSAWSGSRTGRPATKRGRPVADVSRIGQIGRSQVNRTDRTKIVRLLLPVLLYWEVVLTSTTGRRSSSS